MWHDLEDAINELNDNASGWWPFLFMRPAPCERMSVARVFALSVLYGLPAALIANIAIKATHERPDLHPLLLPTAVALAFFACYWLTFARCWNRRAARLALLNERAERFRATFRSQEDD
jgi:hypothetical protein